MTSKDKLARIEALERANVSAADGWWREMCIRYHFPVIPFDSATTEERNAVMDCYLKDFY